MERTLLNLIIYAIFLLTSCTNSDGENNKPDNQPTGSDRYCLALDLKPDSDLMEEYQHLHSPEGMWPEIPDGIRKSGCLDMEIYLVNNNMFMIVEIPEGENLDEIWKKMSTYERQTEWAEFMLRFQQAVKGHGDEVQWVLMEKIYDLDDYN